ncbi:MAG: zinc ribbon domain-containing protein [Blautia sp.]|nr:zinc ribbon domain-containing protein [Blautia sp.]
MDKFTGTINNAGENAARIAKDRSEIGRCNNQIADGERKIHDLYLQIGEYLYTNRPDTADEQIQELFQQLDKEKQVIYELESRIIELKGEERCPACGAAVAKDSLFCNHCGVKLERPEKIQKRCPVCGAAVEFEGQQFCTSCGIRLNQEEEFIPPRPENAGAEFTPPQQENAGAEFTLPQQENVEAELEQPVGKIVLTLEDGDSVSPEEKEESPE